MESPLYEEMYLVEEKHWWFRAKREIVAEMLKRYCGAGQDLNIVDLGCGCGYTVQYLSSTYKNIVGADIAPEAVEFCKKRCINVCCGYLPDGHTFEPESFDAVLLLDVLEHIDDDKPALLSAIKILKPGGVIIATVPAHPSLWTRRDEYHQHKRRYSKKEFAELFNEKNVEKILMEYYNSILFAPIWGSRTLSKILKTDKFGPDINIPAPPVNFIFERLFAAEKHILGRIPMPTGVSFIGVYRKK